MKFRPGSCSDFRLISVFGVTRGSGASEEENHHHHHHHHHHHTLRMARRLLWFCLMTVLGSVTSQGNTEKLAFSIEKNTLKCEKGEFEPEPLTSGHFKCCQTNNDNNEGVGYGEDITKNCTYARVKILSAENLIQWDWSALIMFLVGDLLVTALIGWAVYTVCGQPSTRTSYQDSKASDRKSLIPNERVSNNASGDTYQRLNTRADEYSTLHAGRKQKNPKHPISP